MFLFEVEKPTWKYVLKSALLAFGISITINTLISLVLNAFSISNGSSLRGTTNVSISFIDFISFTIVAPLLETALMVPMIFALLAFTKSLKLVVLITSFIWALFHSLAHPLWGIPAFFSFVILTIIFLTWRKISTLYGFAITTCTHMVINSFAFFSLWFLSATFSPDHDEANWSSNYSIALDNESKPIGSLGKKRNGKNEYDLKLIQKGDTRSWSGKVTAEKGLKLLSIWTNFSSGGMVCLTTYEGDNDELLLTISCMDS